MRITLSFSPLLGAVDAFGVARDVLALHGPAEGAHLPLARRAPARRLDAEAHLAERHLEPRELHQLRLESLHTSSPMGSTAPNRRRPSSSQAARLRYPPTCVRNTSTAYVSAATFPGSASRRDALAPPRERNAALGVEREPPVRHHGLLCRARLAPSACRAAANCISTSCDACTSATPRASRARRRSAWRAPRRASRFAARGTRR